MRDAGLSMAAGLPNKLLLDTVRTRMGMPPKDREGRDFVQLPLREVGLMGIGLFDSKMRAVIPDVWKSKSNYCLYVLHPEAKELLSHVPEEEFSDRLDEWLADTANRKARIASAQAAAAAALAGGRLVPLTIEKYCKTFHPNFRVVFVDDSDGARIPSEYSGDVAALDVPLHLGTRWPDIILYNDETSEFWIVDCVESDGEVDYVRRGEMLASFLDRGHKIAGFTTAYRTLKRFMERQAAHDNIADGTYVWIMEIGGSHFLKLSVAEPLPQSHRR